MMDKIRVLLVDDHAILREGLRALLSYYDDVEVVGEARDGQEAAVSVKKLQPNVVLMDIAMPRMNGLEATRLIHQQYPHTRVLVLTQHEDRQYVLPLLQAGASGYILKRALGTDLVAAVRAVARGETYLYPSVTSVVVEEVHHQAEGETVMVEPLTLREREVLRHIVAGKTNSRIANALCLSVKTVEWHRANLMSKLGVHSVADLVRYALQHGLAEESRDGPDI
jgi:DNA-binding NarL/FixJ family response regulator